MTGEGIEGSASDSQGSYGAAPRPALSAWENVQQAVAQRSAPVCITKGLGQTPLDE